MADTGYQLTSSTGQSYEIDPAGLTIGRALTNNIIIPEANVSRLHARILYSHERFWIRDENSDSGVFVNGQRVAGQQELLPRDELKIGSVTFHLAPVEQAVVPPISPRSGRARQSRLVYVGVAGVTLVLVILGIALLSRPRAATTPTVEASPTSGQAADTPSEVTETPTRTPVPKTPTETPAPRTPTKSPTRTVMPRTPTPYSTPVISGQPVNLANPSFESGFTGWNYGGDPSGARTQIDTAIAHSGSKSLRITFDGSANVDYSQVGQGIAVEPNTTYLLQAYMQVSGIRAYHGVQLMVTDGRGWDYLGYVTPDMYTTQNWTLISTIPFTTLADTNTLWIAVARSNRDWNLPIGGTVWIDDVSLVRLPPQISPSTLTLRVGEVQEVKATSGTAPFVWKSSDNAVAKVKATGDTTRAQVTAMSNGSASITAVDARGKTALLTLTIIKQSTITINANRILRQVPETMFGSNITYNSGVDIISNPVFIADVAKLGLTFLRYPGGYTANYYNFSLGKGYTDWPGGKPAGSEQYNTVGIDTDHFIRFLRAAGIPNAMITANVYKSGNKNWPGNNWISSKVAADWVRYTNRTLGFHVEYWELGNEIFYNGEIPWGEPQVPGLTQELYIQKIHEWSRAMKAVDPTIKIGASLQTPEGKGGAEEWWNLGILQDCASDIDFVIIHPYIFADSNYLKGGAITDSTVMNVYARIWAMNPVANMRQSINTIAPGRAKLIEIQASEWAVTAYPDVSDSFDTLFNAVLNTDLLWDMVQEGADGANLWNLYEVPFPSLEAVPGGKKYAQYQMLWMNRNRSGKWLVESQVSSPTYSAAPYGADSYSLMMYGMVDGVPYLSAYATLSDDGSHLYLIVTNKSAESQTTTINLDGFTPQSRASVWQMTSAHWGDTGVKPVTSTITNAASTFTYTFPARSVTSFIFDIR